MKGPGQGKYLEDQQYSSHLSRCCGSIAERHGVTDLQARVAREFELTPPKDRKAAVNGIVKIALELGLRTRVLRYRSGDFTRYISRLPLVAEMYSGGCLVINHACVDRNGRVENIDCLFADKSEGLEAKTVPYSSLKKLISGGLLFFEPVNTALVCFSIVARENRIELTRDRLRHEYNLDGSELSSSTMIRMSKDLGIKARLLTMDWQGLAGLKKAFPAIAVLKNGRHLLVAGIVAEQDGRGQELIVCYDPLAAGGGSSRRLTREEFEEIWAKKVFLFKRIYSLTSENQPFSLRWFIPEILRQKHGFTDVALAVLFINAVALITPIFFQIVIDKVLVNQAFTTLHALGIGMVIVLLVNGCLDYLRDYLLLHATNKIDLRVTGKTFRHMLHLPLEFFEKVTAGVLTKHMQQTSNIRSFLTGSVFMTMLEATSLFVFLPFLFFYSSRLTSIVLGFTLVIGLVMLLLIAPFRKRLDLLYEAEGRRQAMLVETINGMQTVKAMAIEPLLRNRWEEKVARAVSMQFRVGRISIIARSLTRTLERLMTVMLIWMGASQVFNGTITVGALIAFQMLAGRVTSPLVRLVGLVHQYQEAALSVEKLGVVMNAREERGAGKHGASPDLNGDIVFDRVGFRYAPDLPDVLKEVTFTIPAGTTFGLAGPSGSGKTTLIRMLQKVCFPTTGTIRMGGVYLNEHDTAHLRRNTGIVLQESFLFRATVADNIKAGQAAATRQQIIEAAILAGADEFIVNLPKGYDTMVEEGGSNLSGGQRQRLAIARALLSRPDLLILDEATSSLDPESERIVRENLVKIAQGRTVVMVSHRLSMLRDADTIMVLDRGRVVGLGRHDELLTDCPLYQKMWEQQNGETG